MIILIDSSQRTITVLADNGFPWKFSEKDPYVAKCVHAFSALETSHDLIIFPIIGINMYYKLQTIEANHHRKELYSISLWLLKSAFSDILIAFVPNWINVYFAISIIIVFVVVSFKTIMTPTEASHKHRLNVANSVDKTVVLQKTRCQFHVAFKPPLVV